MSAPAPSSAPSQSQAWVVTARGLPLDVMQLVTRDTPVLPPPTPLPSAVPTPEEWLLVKVAFVGLNIGGIMTMTLLPPYFRAKEYVPELDFSGCVVDVWHPEAAPGAPAPPAARFRKGDTVVGMLPAGFSIPTGAGALAEYIRVPARYVCPKPEHIELGDAAGVMTPGLTARLLIQESGAKEGDRVLVNAASGGIGTLAVQMLRKVVGPTGYIVGICSERNVELVKSLGADEVVDYTKHAPLVAHLRNKFGGAKFDTIIDTLGHQALYTASPAYLKETGVFESVGIKPQSFAVADALRAVWQMVVNSVWPTSGWFLGTGRRWSGASMMKPTLEDRQAIVDMLAAGDIRLVRDSIWPFERANEGYNKVAGLHARGKVLVKVDPAVGDNQC